MHSALCSYRVASEYASSACSSQPARRARRRFSNAELCCFRLTATGALLINISLIAGEFARTELLAFPPLSELTYSPGVGVDYYLWAIQISGVGTLIGGINLLTTILKTRAPAWGYMRMPVFLLDGARLASPHRRRLSSPYRNPGHVAARPLPRFPLCHEWVGRQRQPHLDGVIPRSTSSPCLHWAFTPRLCRPFPARLSSAIARWWPPRLRSA